MLPAIGKPLKFSCIFHFSGTSLLLYKLLIFTGVFWMYDASFDFSTSLYTVGIKSMIWIECPPYIYKYIITNVGWSLIHLHVCCKASCILYTLNSALKLVEFLRINRWWKINNYVDLIIHFFTFFGGFKCTCSLKQKLQNLKNWITQNFDKIITLLWKKAQCCR